MSPAAIGGLPNTTGAMLLSGLMTFHLPNAPSR
jgi:hypothetical protein